MISNDSLPGYATGFRAESSETLAQRVDKLERQVLALERDRDLKDDSEK